MKNPLVNRYLANKAMDHIDHALGRPVDPLRESYRNYFAIDTSSDLAAGFAASPHWEERNRAGDMVWFSVTREGRRALADHLRSIAEPHRAFAITYSGHTICVAATTRGRARYSTFLDITDTCPDLTFGEFCKRSSVRLAGAA